VHDVALHGVEERFHVGVVGDLAGAVHALHEAERGQPISEGIGGVFDAAVGVEDDPGARASVEDGAIEGGQREADVAGGPEALADDASRVDPSLRPGTARFRRP
jgi:hypothetical protein